MDNRDFYSDLKYCTTCLKYVSYMMSMDHSYCCECGQRVKLFSNEDWSNFHDSIARAKPKGGRPRGKERDQRGRESA